MQELKYPFFNKDRVLKIEMLNNLRDFPRLVTDIYADELSDGILWGLRPTIDKQIITFSKGIIKYNGKIYLIPNDISIDYKETDVDVIIKIKFYEEVEDKDFRSQYFEIEIDESLVILDNEQELGRFKLKKGAYLRSDYKDLYDFTTEFNTINIVNIKYSGIEKYTISREILKYFSKAALETKTQNPMDVNFCLLCLNSQRIERDTIYEYINYKLSEDNKKLSNDDIHCKLVKILEQMKRENNNKRKGIKGGRQIIVD